MNNIYICYEKTDRDVVNDIVDYLDRNGINCSLVPDSIPKDETYISFVPKAISNCDIFLLIASNNILKSKWISKEIEYAINGNKEIIQFVLEDFELNDTFSFLLSGTKIVDAKEDYLKQVDNIILEIKNGINEDNHKEVEIPKEINAKNEKEIINIKPENGIGKCEVEDGGIYEGEWLNGKKNGYGIITYPNKDRIFCTYTDDIIGKVFIFMPHDSVPTYGLTSETEKYTKIYENKYVMSAIENIALHNPVEKKDKKNNVYYGMTKFLGSKNGIGELKYSDGERYIGFWYLDEKKSFGRNYYTDKSVYYGFWNESRKNGIGVQILENGDLFFGLFKDGVSQYGIKVENSIMTASIENFEDYSKDIYTDFYIKSKGRLYKPRKILEYDAACPYCHGYGKKCFFDTYFLDLYEEKGKDYKGRTKTFTAYYTLPISKLINCSKCTGTGKLKM